MIVKKDRPIRKCAVCGRLVQPGNGLRNAHAVVCGWKCSGIWNDRRNVSFAWGPNR